MKSTKEKIVHSALYLFNKHGVENITTRHIAKEIGISHGNLCYHYSNKEELIVELYKTLMMNLDAVTAHLQTEKIDLLLLVKVIKMNFVVFNKFKFIMVDLVQISRRIPAIKEYYGEYVFARENEFRRIIKKLIVCKILKKEEVKNQYDHLLTQLFIIGDYWLSHAELLYKGSEKDKISFYTNVFFNLIFPHLTEDSKKHMKKIVDGY